MKIIGITGGVGSGKSSLLQYIGSRYDCRILFADAIAKELEEPGGSCYEDLVRLLGRQILQENGNLLSEVNLILHPAVRETIQSEIEAEKRRGKVRFFFIEAALLIECGYEEIVDEIWFIHAPRDVRRKRLQKERGYSEGRINGIFANQLPEETFFAHADVVIENGGTFADACRQVDEKLGERT